MALSFLRVLRGPLLTVALLLFSSGSLLGQPTLDPGGTLGGTEAELARWAVTQGGLLVVVLVVIWSYRRDFSRSVTAERERADRAMTMMERTIAATVAHSDALRVQTDCVNRLAENVKLCQMVQELLHTRAQE